jgi:hypothetical protein
VLAEAPDVDDRRDQEKRHHAVGEESPGHQVPRIR